ATRILRFAFAPSAARASHFGAAPSPAITMAEFRKKYLRFSMASPPLEIRRAQHEPRQHPRRRRSTLQPFCNRLVSLLRSVATQYIPRDRIGILAVPSLALQLYAGHLTRHQRRREIHAS